MKILALIEDIAQADGLLADCDAALVLQLEQLNAVRQALISVDGGCRQLSEERRQADAQADELRRRLATLTAHAAADFAAAQPKRCRCEALFASAAKIHAQREQDARAFRERARSWELQVDAWFEDGHMKRFDPIVYNVNRPLFGRVRELLNAEESLADRRHGYLSHTDRRPGDEARKAQAEQLGQLHATLDDLSGRRADFGAALATSLTSYLRDGLGRNAKAARDLEVRLHADHEKVQGLRIAHGLRGQPAREAWTATLGPLGVLHTSLDAKMHAVEAEHRLLVRVAID